MNAEVQDVVAATQDVAHEVASSPLVDRLTRLGHAVRGLLYGTTGLLAIQVARGAEQARVDQIGVITLIAGQPLGRLVLVVMAAGLVGYLVWSLTRVLLRSPDLTAFDRLGGAAATVTTGILLAAIGRVLMGLPAETRPPVPVHSLLLTPIGLWMVGIAGGIAMAVGIAHLIKAWRSDFARKFERYALSPDQMTWACRAGRVGTAARGVVIGLVGVFLLQAALQVDPEEIKGLDEALRELANEPLGPWLLGAVAVGLLAYGLYSFLGALWFRLKPGDSA